MTLFQRLLTRILPAAWARDLIAESQTWLVRCPNCDLERSIWNLGGIRWRAKGSPRQELACPRCGQTGWHTIYRSTDAGKGQGR